MDYDEFDDNVSIGDEDDFETNYRAERNVFDRLALPGMEFLDSGEGGKMNRTAIDKFSIYVDAVSRNIMETNAIDITQNDIVTMLQRARKIKMINYKNPTAFVLGYLVSNGGRSINTEHLNTILKNILPYLQDKSIKAPDIIRYARLWILNDYTI